MGVTPFNPTWLLSILPELLLLALAVVVLGVDLALPAERKRTLGLWTAAGLVVILLVTVLVPLPQGPAFGGAVRIDGVAGVFRVIFLLGGILVALMSMDFRPLRQDGPYYGLLLFSLLGMSLMAVAENLVTLYVAMELTGISAYVLVGYMRETEQSAEAGLKYFLFGAFSSAVMLYGFSWLYAFAGGTGYGQLAQAIRAVPFPLAVLAFLMVLVGFGFKVAMVPMHFWAPDVYQGAPTPITAFLSVGSKAAGFAVLLRALRFLFPGRVRPHRRGGGLADGGGVGGLLPHRLHGDERRRVCGGGAGLQPDRERGHREFLRAGPAVFVPGVEHDAGALLAGGCAALRWVRGEVAHLRRRDPERAHRADGGGCCQCDYWPVLLPERGEGGL